MSTISTHVLDLVLGKPAAGVLIRLEEENADAWSPIATAATDLDGRCGKLKENMTRGTYRLTFATGSYLMRLARTTIYPEISIIFHCDGESHYHLPLLLSDNGYTTYRGS